MENAFGSRYIGKLKNLQELSILNSQLKKLPLTIGNLKNLKLLEAGATQIKELLFIASLFWKKLQTFLENVASPFWRNVHLHGATYAAPWKQTFFVKSY